MYFKFNIKINISTKYKIYEKFNLFKNITLFIFKNLKNRNLTLE